MGNPVFCHWCHREVPAQEVRHIQGRNIDVCLDCADDKYSECSVCHDYVARNDLVYCASENDEVCIWCLSEKYLLCPHCSEFIPTEQAVKFHDHWLCPKCRKEYFKSCALCRRQVESDELTNVRSHGGSYIDVCPNCLEHSFFTCVECEYITPKQDAKEYAGKLYCKSCFDCNFTKCQICSKVIPNDDIQTVYTNDKRIELCKKCADLYGDCSSCYKTLHKSKLYVVQKGVMLCAECLQQHQEYQKYLKSEKIKNGLGMLVAGVALAALLPTGKSDRKY